MIDDNAADPRARVKLVSRRCVSGPSNNESHSRSSATHDFAEIEVETAALRQAMQRRNARFLKGPIPMRDIAAASRLPGKALTVFLAIRHRADLTHSIAVKLPARLMGDLGVSKDAKARALRQLEAMGLITVQRKRGCSP